MSSSVQRPLSTSQSRIENMSLGVPDSESLFDDQQPWRVDLENRGWTANGKITNAGRMHYYLSAPPTWIKIDGDGSIAIDPAFFFAPSVVGNDDPTNPKQKEYNRLCQRLLLHDSIARDVEVETAHVETTDLIAQSRSQLKKNYDQYYTHPHDTLEPNPTHGADSTYKNSFEFRAAEVAKAAEQLSRFLPTRGDLSNAPNARHTRPGQTTPNHRAIMTTAPSQPFRIQTTSQDSRQSWEENRTPDELKIPALPPVISPTRLSQPQSHPKRSIASGGSFIALNRSLKGGTGNSTKISDDGACASRDRLLSPFSKLKAKFTQRERKPGA